MIDFRYHLVSLVSVFIALAIGVVLGAGPLGGALGDTLNNQIVALRQDKVALQQAVDNRDATIAGQDSAITSVAPALVQGTLTGRQVTVIVLPGTSAGQLDAVLGLLDQAGVPTPGSVAVQPAWSNPAATANRSAALQGVSGGTEPEQALAQLLAGALFPGSATTAAPSLDPLTANGLVSVTTQTGPAQLAVVLGPAPGQGAAGTDEAWQQAEEQANLAIVRALADRADRVVAAGPGAPSAGVLVASVRDDDDLQDTVFTVDDLDRAPGPLAVVLALAQPDGATALHLGTGAGAGAVLPPVPARDTATATATTAP